MSDGKERDPFNIISSKEKEMNRKLLQFRSVSKERSLAIKLINLSYFFTFIPRSSLGLCILKNIV